MGFPTKNDHFGVFWGYHHLRKHPLKHPNGCPKCVWIVVTSYDLNPGMFRIGESSPWSDISGPKFTPIYSNKVLMALKSGEQKCTLVKVDMAKPLLELTNSSRYVNFYQTLGQILLTWNHGIKPSPKFGACPWKYASFMPSQKETIVLQASIFRGELWILGSVLTFGLFLSSNLFQR